MDFMCLIQAKRLVDLLVESIPFDGRFKLDEKPTRNTKTREGEAPQTPQVTKLG